MSPPMTDSSQPMKESVLKPLASRLHDFYLGNIGPVGDHQPMDIWLGSDFMFTISGAEFKAEAARSLAVQGEQVPVGWKLVEVLRQELERLVDWLDANGQLGPANAIRGILYRHFPAPWNNPQVRWVCEAHPDKDFPHDDCPGPGMPEAMLSSAPASPVREREKIIEECINAAREMGNFGDYRRDELTANYGQPRFDMMNDIIAAIAALKDSHHD